VYYAFSVLIPYEISIRVSENDSPEGSASQGTVAFLYLNTFSWTSHKYKVQGKSPPTNVSKHRPIVSPADCYISTRIFDA
jgi:hypothetical protein